MAIRCGYCKKLHATKQQVRDCPNNVAELEQVAEHGRAQAQPYPREQKLAQAAERRRSPSPTERRLDEALSADGRLQFKREVEIEGYVVDFYFPRARVVVELDSSHHVGRELYDERRTQILTANRYEVLRFRYHEVMNETDRIVEELVRLVAPIQQRRRRRRKKSYKKSPHEVRSDSRQLQRLVSEAERDREYEKKRKRRAAGGRSRQKYRFQCQGCSHEFWASSKPWPQCNACQTRAPVRCVCSEERCGVLFSKHQVGSRCSGCARRDRDIRSSMKGGISEDWKSGRHTKGT